MNFAPLRALQSARELHLFFSSILMMITGRVRRSGAVLLALALLAALSGPAAAAGRVALVMAAEEYAAAQPSGIGVKRAAAIAEALERLDFDVVMAANPTNATARARLREFSDAVGEADLAIVVLAGHGITWSGQTFFLPANTDIGRPTDLLSRALSLGSITQITGRAKAGGVFFFVSQPRFRAPVAGLDPRPTITGEAPAGTVVALSTASSVPVSQIDTASAQAADAALAVLAGSDPTLKDLLGALEDGGRALVVGTAADMPLRRPADPPPQPVAVAPVVPETVARGASEDASADRLALEEAEEAIALERQRADEARLAAEKAQADVLKAQAEAAKAQADAEKAQADARKAQADAQRALAEAERTKAEAEAEVAVATPDDTTGTVSAEPMDERDLGRRQRQLIQEKLRDMSLYTGPIDSIMGPLTREAIMGFQKGRGAAVTGYLTPDQYDALLATGE